MSGSTAWVKSLKDSGPDTLRAAVTNPKVSRVRSMYKAGDIMLDSPIVMCYRRDVELWLRGLTLHNWGFHIRDGCENVDLNGLAVRPGSSADGSPRNTNGLVVWGEKAPVRNITVRNCSFTDASDENGTLWGDVGDVRIEQCIFSRGLRTGHTKGVDHASGLLANCTGKMTVRGCLLSHNYMRNPQLCSPADVVNCLISCNRNADIRLVGNRYDPLGYDGEFAVGFSGAIVGNLFAHNAEREYNLPRSVCGDANAPLALGSLFMADNYGWPMDRLSTRQENLCYLIGQEAHAVVPPAGLSWRPALCVPELIRSAGTGSADDRAIIEAALSGAVLA